MHMEKPIEFKGRKEIVNGKEALVVEPIAIVTKHADGRQDVTLKMPSLKVIAKAKELYDIE